MAANRLESTPGTDDPAAAAAAAAAAPPSAAAGGFKAWLPLVATILVMPALAFAMTNFVLLPRLQKSLGISSTAAAGEHGGEKGGKEAPAKRESVMMNKLLVNVAGTMGARYLLVSLSLVSTEADFRKKMEEADPQLRDMAMGVLATKTIADLEKPGARNLIRSELMAGFNNILSGAYVKEIYLTEFAIQ